MIIRAHTNNVMDRSRDPQFILIKDRLSYYILLKYHVRKCIFRILIVEGNIKPIVLVVSMTEKSITFVFM